MPLPTATPSRNGAGSHGNYGKGAVHDFDNPICTTCGDGLMVGQNWHVSAFRSHRYSCKACSQKRHQAWRERNRDKERGYARQQNRKVSGRFVIAKSQASRRSVVWDLSKDEYTALIQNPCHYCGHPLNSTGSGLDQIKPGLGYTTGNVVPCCHECNTAKHDHFTYEEMLLIGNAIKEIKNKRAEEVSRA